MDVAALDFQSLNFLEAAQKRRCGLSTIYKLPYVTPEEAEHILPVLQKARAHWLFINYLTICRSAERLGKFDDLRIKVTLLEDPSEGGNWAIFNPPEGTLESLQSYEAETLPRLQQLTPTTDRLVSEKFVPRKLHKDPVVNNVKVAMTYWTERLWDSKKSNHWVDHYHSMQTWAILNERGITTTDPPDKFDVIGFTKDQLLRSPRVIEIMFDYGEVKFLTETQDGKGYADTEIPQTAFAGLSQPYSTDVKGVLEMLSQFRACDWGKEFPEPDGVHEDAPMLTVCISYRRVSRAPKSRFSFLFKSSSNTTFSPMHLEQLSHFLLSMNRFHAKIRFWCDVILKSREVNADNWETVGLEPYMIWPTLYLSNYQEEPENASYNRLWVRIEQFCAAFGRGTYIFGFDTSQHFEENPWSRPVERSSALQSSCGRLGGRHEGLYQTKYLLIRAFRYGVFDEFVFETWREYYNTTFKSWASAEELKLLSRENVFVSPFIFSDELGVSSPPPTMLVTKVLKAGVDFESFEGVKTLLPVGEKLPITQALPEEEFISAEVRTEEKEDGSVRFVVISRPQSGYANCWMCEVWHGASFPENGKLMKIVHYVSSSGNDFPRADRSASEDDDENMEKLRTYCWFSEALHVIGRLDHSVETFHMEWEDTRLDICPGLPNWS